ncbi:MAG: hypothetical protein KIT72_08550 [Polyangiaceae bacterium]|nr:hypothetical protein [Polyangiaceae bacterium]MCW5790457.1 hypothetical protein [Polyangiaceae bacterium]
MLKEVPVGWRIAFVGYAFPDEYGTLSAHAFDEVLGVVRGTSTVHLPRFAARVAEASGGGAERDLPELRRVNPKITTPRMEELKQAIARDAPDFASRLGNAMLAELEQPFLARTTILEIISPAPMPARTLYLARAADESVHVLTARADALRAVLALDPPQAPDDPALARFTAVLTRGEVSPR